LPVASLWASLDYKSVANWPIMVSRILYITILISEIKQDTSFKSCLYWAKIILTTHQQFTAKNKMAAGKNLKKSSNINLTAPILPPRPTDLH